MLLIWLFVLKCEMEFVITKKCIESVEKNVEKYIMWNKENKLVQKRWTYQKDDVGVLGAQQIA